MGTAEIIKFPRVGTARKHHQGGLRRPLPSNAQERVNAIARQGYRWAQQDMAPLVAIAFLYGAFLTLAIVRWS